jgi:hypothetical protein
VPEYAVEVGGPLPVAGLDPRLLLDGNLHLLDDVDDPGAGLADQREKMSGVERVAAVLSPGSE